MSALRKAEVPAVMRAAMSKAVVAALASLTADSGGGWSGLNDGLLAALQAHAAPSDRDWIAAVDDVLDVADAADLADAELRLWRVGNSMMVVSDRPHAFAGADGEPLPAVLGNIDLDSWRRRHVEEFARLGDQEAAEAVLVGEWSKARATLAEPHLCAFCGLTAEPGMVTVNAARVHESCATAAKRQHAVWTDKFVALVRERPEELPLMWDDPASETTLPMSERAIATPTPTGLMDRIRLFIAECCDLGPDFNEDRPALFEAWAHWCQLRHIDHGAVDQFRINLLQVGDGIRAAPRPSWSGRSLWAGLKLKEPEADDIEIAASAREANSADTPIALFVRAECTLGPDLQIPARDLYGAFLRRPGSSAAGISMEQFVDALRAIAPGVEAKRTRGLRQIILHGIGIGAPR